jgi:hypothetical protein
MDVRSSFEPIAMGLQGKNSPLTLELQDCQFDRDATIRFQEVFTTSNQGHTLKLDSDVLFVLRHIHISAGPLLDRMLQHPADSGLRHLDLFQPRPRDVQAIMLALERNPWLEGLVLGSESPVRRGNTTHHESGRVDPESARYIIDSLPHLDGLKKLKIAFQVAAASQMMAALRANKSLEDIFIDASFLTEDDQATLRSFASRNAERRTTFHRLVSLKLWHPAARMTECETGKDVVFRSFVAWGDRLELNTDGAASQRHSGDDD